MKYLLLAVIAAESAHVDNSADVVTIFAIVCSIFGIIGVISSVVFGILLIKARKKAVAAEQKAKADAELSKMKAEGVQQGKLDQTLDTITSGIAVIDSTVKDIRDKQEKQHVDVVERVVKVEGLIGGVDEKAKSAHKRIDREEKRVDTIIDHLALSGQYDKDNLPPKSANAKKEDTENE